jgi:hypothetical protein
MKSLLRRIAGLGMAGGLVVTCGCHSYHIDAEVENQTGSQIRLMEVDYPSASFGADNLPAGAVMHYRFQVQGNGPLKVQYTTGDGRQVQNDGPTFTERQEGSLKIILLPNGKADFHPVVTAKP